MKSTSLGKSGSSTTAERIAEIIALIKETVDRDSWRDSGGETGNIRSLGSRLVITQSKQNHRAIAELIKVLHQRAKKNRSRR